MTTTILTNFIIKYGSFDEYHRIEVVFNNTYTIKYMTQMANPYGEDQNPIYVNSIENISYIPESILNMIKLIGVINQTVIFNTLQSIFIKPLKNDFISDSHEQEIIKIKKEHEQEIIKIKKEHELEIMQMKKTQEVKLFEYRYLLKQLKDYSELKYKIIEYTNLLENIKQNNEKFVLIINTETMKNISLTNKLDEITKLYNTLIEYS